RERYLEEREIDVGAVAVAAGLPDARDDRERSAVAAPEVSQREAALGRGATRLARDALPAREPLEGVVVGSLALPRAVHAEAGERAANEARVDRPQLVIAQAH